MRNLYKLNWGLILLLFSVFTFYSCEKKQKLISDSKEKTINENWQFLIDTIGISNPGYFDSMKTTLNWEKVSLPHTTRIEPKVVNDQWQGNCWYRKSITYDSLWKGKTVYIRFEGAMNIAEVWMNGNKKITHYGGYLPFVIDITEDLHSDSDNNLLIKLNNEDSPITGPKPLKELDFNMYGGLYRDVKLLVKNPVHISDEQFAGEIAGGGIFITYPEVSEKEAKIAVKTNIVNSGVENLSVRIQQILEKNGKTVKEVSTEVEVNSKSDSDVKQELLINMPELWSPDSPELYNLITRIYSKKTILDEKTTRIGIRKFEFIDNKLYLNNNPIFLRGVNRHQEYPYIGYAISKNAEYRDAFKIKQAGFDYVRFSHYPHSTDFLNACDELGIVAIDAIPGWQYYRDYEPFRKQVLQTCRDMIRRDRNHPSVLAWEVSLNESWMPEEFIDSLTKIAHEEYPYEDCYSAGWQEYGFDIYFQARQHRIGHEDKGYPDKPYIVSEYGDWEYYAMNAGFNQDSWGDLLPDERSSRQYLGSGEKRLLQQTMNIQEAHNDNFKTPAVADGYWVMFDYNRGYSNDLETSGISDIFRIPKFSYFFFKSQRKPASVNIPGIDTGPMVKIASFWQPESSTEIRVFSNCEEVSLSLNDKLIERKKAKTDKYSDKLKYPPFTFSVSRFEKGMLIANGFIKGELVISDTVKTPEEPESLSVIVDLSNKKLSSDSKDFVFVYAKVTDANGTNCPLNGIPITFSVEGGGKIIGENPVVSEAGYATILLETVPGAEIKISASAENLKTGELQIQ